MYGSSIAQMKTVCSALTECEGFNSEGWVKSRISQKKRSTIDLYLKQVIENPPQLVYMYNIQTVQCIEHLHVYV